MKKLIGPVVKYAIDKAKRNKFIQNVFESPFDLSKLSSKGNFTDSKGNKHPLYEGLRSKIRPGWQVMLTSKAVESKVPDLDALKSDGVLSLEKLLPLIKTAGISVKGSTILEVGCHSGSVCYAFADEGAKEVIGSEFSGYKVESVEMNEVSDKNLQEANDDLKTLRTNLGKRFNNPDKVAFVDDDICNSRIERNDFDIVCSWEVLEHIHDPEGAFKSIAKMLKPNGIMVHEYNPFFCLNGGHSLCTLDFLWGHTRLSEKDFEEYLDKLRPEEKERAMSFYLKGLNRMTISDLTRHIENAGLETICILPFTKEQHVKMVDHETLQQSSDNYPNLSLIDLVAPRVFVMARKP